METQKTNSTSKYLFLCIIILSLIFSSTACAQKFDFINSSIVPAAKGTVKIKQDKNNNYTIKVDIFDLAEVERLQPTKQTYVVWIETERGFAENIGQLKSSTSIFSKQHKATLKTVSSYKPIKLFVTAEDGLDIRYPDKQVILTTDVF